MLGYILRRIVQMVPVLFLISLFAFFLVRLVPGDPVTIMLGNRANDENIAQKANAWSARNFTRYRNPEFDAIHLACRTETDPEAFANAFIEMNDILYNDAAVIPLVRTVGKTGLSKKLNQLNVSPAQFNYDTWNIANWNHAPNE